MRRYLSPRAIGLGLAAGILITAMVLLGLWQLGAYDDRQHADAAAQLQRDPVPFEDLMGPDDAFPADAAGRSVTVEGRYVASEQLYVDGFPGADDRYAVVTPLRTDSGSAVLVVRGSAPEPSAVVPPGDIEVVGRLQPPTPQGGPLDDRRITEGLRISALVNDVRDDLYGAFVIASGETAGDGLSAVSAVSPHASPWAGIRNLLYAIQWWVFAGFVAFMWWRIVTDLETPAPDSRKVG